MLIQLIRCFSSTAWSVIVELWKLVLICLSLEPYENLGMVPHSLMWEPNPLSFAPLYLLERLEHSTINTNFCCSMTSHLSLGVLEVFSSYDKVSQRYFFELLEGSADMLWYSLYVCDHYTTLFLFFSCWFLSLLVCSACLMFLVFLNIHSGNPHFFVF